MRNDSAVRTLLAPPILQRFCTYKRIDYTVNQKKQDT